MTKKSIFILSVLLTILFVVSCTTKTKQKTRQEQVEEFRSLLTASDTTQMLQLCDNAMELLKGNKIDEVLASLNEYNDSTKKVRPLSDLVKNRLRKQFKMFPVLDYRRMYYSFMLEGCNDVKYDVVFSTAEHAGTKDAPTTAFMFNPVKVDGEWKLCVKSASDEFDVTQN